MRHGERDRGKKQAAVVVIMLFEYNLKIIGDLNSIQGLSTSSSVGQHEIDTHKFQVHEWSYSCPSRLFHHFRCYSFYSYYVITYNSYICEWREWESCEMDFGSILLEHALLNEKKWLKIKCCMHDGLSSMLSAYWITLQIRTHYRRRSLSN